MNDELLAELRASIRADINALLSTASQPTPRWLSVDGAAAYAGLSPVSIRRLLKRGVIRAHRPIKGKILIDRIELDSVVSTAVAEVRKGRGIRRA